jgi:hypothetical protein
MAKVHTEWRVLPHSPIEKLSDRLWRVAGDLPGVPMKRVMTVAKRADNSLLVHNAIALGDAEMAALAAWGPIRTILVPNGYHRLDAKIFRERFPAARLYCPQGAHNRVAEVVTVDGNYSDVPADPHVELQTLDGTRQREGAVIVRDPGGTSLVLNDIVFNMPHVPGFKGLVLRLLGSSGGPKITPISRRFVVADKHAVRSHLERLAATPNLRRIIVSHHETIANEPGRVLAGLAATL